MKKKKLFKRALAAVLTLTMALGIVPMTAFAEETEYLEGSSFITQKVLDEGLVLTDEDEIAAYLQETETEMHSVQVGADTIEVSKTAYENGSAFALMEDINGNRRMVNLSNEDEIAAVPGTSRKIGAISIQLVRTTSMSVAFRFVIENQLDVIQCVKAGVECEGGILIPTCYDYNTYVDRDENNDIIYYKLAGSSDGSGIDIYHNNFGGYTGNTLLIQLPSFTLSPNTAVVYKASILVQGNYDQDTGWYDSSLQHDDNGNVVRVYV